MNIKCEAAICVGYIIPKELADNLRLTADPYLVKKGLVPLDIRNENSDYFFGRIITQCKAGEITKGYYISDWCFDEVESEYGSYLCLPGDFIPPDEMLINFIVKEK